MTCLHNSSNFKVTCLHNSRRECISRYDLYSFNITAIDYLFDLGKQVSSSKHTQADIKALKSYSVSMNTILVSSELLEKNEQEIHLHITS